MKAWQRVLIFVVACAWLGFVLVRLRPELLMFSRWQGWTAALTENFSSNGGRRGPLPLVSTATFVDRARETKPLAGEKISFYRGHETRDGIDSENQISTKLHVGWRFENLNIALHTASKASPAVDESGIYVGSDAGWFYAFNFDGTLRWRFHAADPMRGIHGTAVLSKSRVCFGSYGATYSCLRKTNGEVIWTMSATQTAYGSSPLVADGELIMGIETAWPIDGFIAKISFEDGSLIWQSKWLGEQIHSSPAFDRGVQRIYFGANNSQVRAVSAGDGSFLWSTNVGGPVKGTPLLAKGGLFVTSWGKNLVRLDPATGAIRWRADLGSTSRSSPTLIPDSDVLVVGSQDAIFGIRATDGRIMWRKPVSVETSSSALVVRDSGRHRWLAWIGCGEESLCAFDAQGNESARIHLPGRLTGVPVAFGHSLYLALDFPGGLVRLDP